MPNLLSGRLAGSAKTTWLTGVVLSRETDGLLLRATASWLKLPNGVAQSTQLRDGLDALAASPLPDVSAQAAALRSAFDFDGHKLRYLALGASLDRADWLLMAELSQLASQQGGNVVLGYASLGRRFGAWTLLAGASAARSSKSAQSRMVWHAVLAPLLGSVAADAAQTLADVAVDADQRSHPHRQTLSLGLRSEFNRWHSSCSVSTAVWPRPVTVASGHRPRTRPSAPASPA